MKDDIDNRTEIVLNDDVNLAELPEGWDRRAFMMRTSMIGAVAVLSGCAPPSPKETAAQATSAPPVGAKTDMSADLDVVKKSKGPVMTTLEEFYKVGPGPSSSHTIGPMRITYDFYQRATKLPADQLAQATALKVHLFGSLSTTGKNHDTKQTSLTEILNKEPTTVNPLFLDEMRDKPTQSYPIKLSDKTFNLTLTNVIYDAPK